MIEEPFTLPPGFALERNWARGVRPADVLDAVRPDLEQRQVRVFGKVYDTPRLVAPYGASYSYSGQAHAARDRMPPVIADLLAQVRYVLDVPFNSVLVNVYRDGRDCVGWHSDDEPELGPEPVIASISLGASRRFGIRRRPNAESRMLQSTYLDLHHGDLLVMSGRSQVDYQHTIGRTRENVGLRVNLTFRTVIR